MANNNDISALLTQLLSSDAVSGISKASKASTSDVSNILAQALPTLLQGATQQANQSSTLEGFGQALQDHAKEDTSDLASFFKNVDLNDGSKIVAHLLGGQTQETTKAVAKKANTNSALTSTVLAAAAPLLMSLLGKQITGSKKTTQSNQAISSLAGQLLGNVDLGSLAGALLGGGTSKKKSGIDLSDGLDLSDVIGIASKLMK